MSTLCVVLALSCLQGIATACFQVGSCDRTKYYIEKTSCDADFVRSMNASSQAFEDCPDLYNEARECFKKKILKNCFSENDPEKYNKTQKCMSEDLMDQDYFCEMGLLVSMEGVMRTVNISTCRDLGSRDYVEFEGKFHDAFKEEFKKPAANFTRLKREFSIAKADQGLVAVGCNLVYGDDTHHFFDPAEFNPFDIESLDAVKDLADKIDKGEEVEEKDTTALTVALVIVVVAIIIAGILFYLWRRDNNRAEHRRLKRESRKGQSISEKNSDAEMQNLSSEAVIQQSDEVGSA